MPLLAPLNLLNNRVVVAVWLLLLVLRVAIAASLPLFGDEAFYWQESRAPAIAYTDLPPMTAWLIALGTSVAGDSVLAVRWPFLLLGSLLPWVMRVWALRRLDNRWDANQVALLTMCLPLIAMSGVLALPDVPLTLLLLSAFVFLDRAADSNRWRDWLGLGLSLAAAMLTHWRAGVVISAGLIWLLFTPRGRACLRQPGLWVALLLALLGGLPVLWFNATHAWVALRFQAFDRNPWTYQSSGLWIGLEQMALLTPFLAAALGVVVLRSWQQRQRAPFDLMLSACLGILAVYFVVGLFADNERMRIHWPLPGYLPLLLAVPELLRAWRLRGGWRRLLAGLVLPSLMVGAVATLAVLGAAASANGALSRSAARVLDTGFIGWQQAASATNRLFAEFPPGSPLIADNFLLGAELDFALAGAHKVFVLDHPRNVRHGRQAQLAIWQRDQRSLHQAQWDRALLVIELHARAPGERLAAWQSLCAQFGSVRWLHEEHVSDSPLGFLFAEVRPRRPDLPSGCRAPVIAHMDFPFAGQAVQADLGLLVQGWAIADVVGVDAVYVVLDGSTIAAAQTHLLAPHVHARLPSSTDPDHPRVGFTYQISPAEISVGRHRIEIEVHSRDRADLVRRFGPLWVQVN